MKTDYKEGSKAYAVMEYEHISLPVSVEVIKKPNTLDPNYIFVKVLEVFDSSRDYSELIGKKLILDVKYLGDDLSIVTGLAAMQNCMLSMRIAALNFQKDEDK